MVVIRADRSGQAFKSAGCRFKLNFQRNSKNESSWVSIIPLAISIILHEYFKSEMLVNEPVKEWKKPRETIKLIIKL